MGFNHGLTVYVKIMKIVDQKSDMTKKMNSTSQKKKNRFWEHQVTRRRSKVMREKWTMKFDENFKLSFLSI